MIEAEGLSVVFGRTVALDALDLELAPGVTGLFGPNGSGKSTLLRAFAGLLKPTRGRLVWCGRRISAADESFRRSVGYAGHEAGLYGRLSVEENLALFAGLHGASRARPELVCAQVGLDRYRSTPVRDLSAGLKRRAAVARALVHEPDLLLLDEPYANLDEDAADMVSSAIRQWRAPGRVAIIATHGAKNLKRWADAGVILRRGRLAAHGHYGSEHRFVSDLREPT
ncbi:ABC transporter ATP-binding protein [soil metagenome]